MTASAVSAASPASNANAWLVDIPTHGSAREMSGSEQRSVRGPHTVFLAGYVSREDWTSTGAHLSDATYVAEQFERFGPTLFATLRGAFSLVVADGVHDRVYAASDPMGAVPLFMATADARVLFSTDPRTLVMQPGVSRSLNRVVFADALSRRYPDPRETFFAAVQRVPPGFLATVHHGDLRLDRYWDPLTDLGDGAPVTEEELRFAFERAIRRATHARPSGVFLSGGIDSVSVACAATHLARTRAEAAPVGLSLGFPVAECDERPLQRAVGQALGLEHELLDFHEAVGRRGLLQESLALSVRMASPLLNAFSVPYLALAQLGRRRGVQTILTGSGGDEWWSVPAQHTADLLRRGRMAALARFWRAWQRAEGTSWRGLAVGLGWHAGLRPLAGQWVSRFHPTWDVRRGDRLLGGDPAWVAPDPVLRAEQAERARLTLGPADPPEGFRRASLRSLLEHPIALLEREEARGIGDLAGVEIASPLLDPDLVAVVSRAAPRLLTDNGYLKSPLRRWLGELLPDLDVAHRPKVLATSFFQTAVLEGRDEALEALGGFKTLGNLGIIDASAAEALVKTSAPATDPKSRAWDLMNAETWAAAYAP